MGIATGAERWGRLGFLSLREGSREWDGEASRDVRGGLSVC